MTGVYLTGSSMPTVLRSRLPLPPMGKRGTSRWASSRTTPLRPV